MDDSSSDGRAQDPGRTNRGILAGQLERLGPAFRQRLARDREQLTALLERVASAGTDAPAALRDLEICAHKLHGTAAMFGHESLGTSAGVVEAAAHRAIADGTAPADAAREIGPLLGTLEREIATAIAAGAEHRGG